MYNTTKPLKLSKFTKYVKNEDILQMMIKYVFMTKYVKTFYCKSREMNLSCFSKNMYLRTNPSPSHRYNYN
jgi:hypothetical protein